MTRGNRKKSLGGTEIWTSADYRAWANNQPHKSKYKNQPIEIDGIRFASHSEGRRYVTLRDLERGGEILNLVCHPQYVIIEGFTDNTGKTWKPRYYVADFSYTLLDGTLVAEDVKGLRTKVFSLKEVLFRQKYPHIRFDVLPAKSV